MICGLGNDIISVKRVQGAIERHGARFLNKIFTSRERAYCLNYKESARHFAGRFAAKEAIVKSLGIGFSYGITWLDIEIVNDDKGKPQVFCSSKLQDIMGSRKVMISISHCHEYATAFAITIE